MKKSILITAFALSAFLANAQLKVISGGLVGINNAAPQHKLDVDAGTYPGLRCIVSHTADFGYGILSYVNRVNTKALAVQLSGSDKFIVYGNGQGWASGWLSWSDKSLKKNIDTLKGALNKVLQMQGYTYNFKDSVAGEVNPKKQIGLLAQDVEAVLPEVVATNENGLKGIAYQNIVALLIEAMKEQDKKMKELRNDLDNCCTKKSDNRMMDQGNNGHNEKEASLQIELANKDKVILYQNEPNPMTNSTVIRYFIPESLTGAAQVVFYDMYGKEVNKLEIKERGFGRIEVNAENLASGIYTYSIMVNDKTVDTKRMQKIH